MVQSETDVQRHSVLGLPIDVCRDVLAAALTLHDRGGGQVVTLNAEMSMAALAQPDLEAVIQDAELVIPDGSGVVGALALQGVRVRRCPGIDLARALLQEAAARQWRVALVGASPQVMAALQVRLTDEIPGLQLVLCCHGFQPAEAWPDLEQHLLALQPDLVLAALGVPRQETWIQRLRQGQPGLWMGVGGSFDVWSGHKKRAPRWMGTLHIEWLYRLVQEPARWRRMLSLPRYALAVLSGSRPTPARRTPAAGRTGE
jgi:N-acetylglucosaminyldiphosphoundecaprenol N-acetyl-beta-D-mannosaminyltransferase